MAEDKVDLETRDDPNNDMVKQVGITSDQHDDDGAFRGVQVANKDWKPDEDNGREKCPACGVHDGVRKGATTCDSCGAGWGNTATAIAAGSPEAAPDTASQQATPAAAATA